MKKAAACLLLAALTAGCSYLDFGLDSDEPEWAESYAAREPSAYQKRTRSLARALAAWEQETAHRSTDYRLGPEDVLEVSVFCLETPGRVTLMRRTISREGHITLPWVGALPAAGLSAPELEQSIASAYAGTYLKKPQVAVNVAEYRSVPVIVTGAVAQPGLYHLSSNRASLLECLALAGGLKERSGDELLIVRAGLDLDQMVPDEASASGRAEQLAARALAAPGREAIAVDLKELVEAGNLLLNLPVKGGDVLIVPARPRSYVYVLGYVRRPGAYELREGNRVDVLRAVALGGGLMTIARASNSYLVRPKGERQVAIPVDLDKVASGELPPLYLKGGDTLVVGTSTFGRVTEFFAPSMGATISASASATP
jgi:polysaccharide export outer membrane protein